MLVSLVLHAPSPPSFIDDGVDLGPGSEASLYVMNQLLLTGDYRISQKFRKDDLPAGWDAELDLKTIVKEVGLTMRVGCMAYWRQRVADEPDLAAIDAEMTALLDRDLPAAAVEGLYCEIVRRRTSALAWARFAYPRAPKSRFDFDGYLKEIESFDLLDWQLLCAPSPGQVSSTSLRALMAQQAARAGRVFCRSDPRSSFS